MTMMFMCPQCRRADSQAEGRDESQNVIRPEFQKLRYSSMFLMMLIGESIEKMNLFDSRRNSGESGLILFNRFGQFFVCTTNRAHKIPFAFRKLGLNRLKSFLFARGQV
jgi:hypothetical protein